MSYASDRATRLTIVYLIFGFLWIAFSDQVLAYLVQDAQTMARMQTLKGWFFVSVTGLMFFLLARRALHQQRELMRRDGLTGLLNRGMLRDEIEHQLELARCQQQKVVLFFINLDGFKQINATYGHAAGDSVLEQFAFMLRRQYGEEALLGRIGADEFVVSLRGDFDSQELDNTALRIMNCCRLVRLPEESGQFSCGIGVSIFPDDGVTAREVMAAGAVATEQAKAAGPGQYRQFNRAFSESFEDRLKLLQEVKQAIRDEAFTVVYQPQFAVDGGDLTGVEVLVRWEHPERGMVPPSRFIPLVEQQGLTHDITRIVLQRAVSELRSSGLLGTAIKRVSINISAQEFESPENLEDFVYMLTQNEDVCKYLQFEITETAIMRNLDATLAAMERLRLMGIRFSIDDFGTGYSSLNMLKQLPLNELKIDQSFIRDIPEDTNDAMIARTIIAMAQSLHIRLVAEGVETEEQKQFLLQNGCDEMQGFLLARPMAVAALRDLAFSTA
ncbi:MAG: bifunctional diguanylate cyclase/phosphodiesterase [Natronospirillum sp.]|uniref:putative bifunctional diguanylate cyclase/phosphodiesterase n=1 Tax=Natronospirillum sp. TaxID=2812955 RepID=UPI0025D5633B|nr:bifunctional diguanylate cyclase/phosphodiesterase [Natronospirillum sp.]MCH8552964.1 bifunctional diguanylate cyclase/phosphodiesterase [Natronospirillum sp.]